MPKPKPTVKEPKPIPHESAKHKAARLAGALPSQQRKAAAAKAKKAAKTKRPSKMFGKQTPAKKKAAKFAFQYHSTARKAFVQRFGCAYCTLLSPFLGVTSAGNCDNAHTGSGNGVALKGHYTTIIPLDRVHHRMYDTREKMFADPILRAALADMAKQIEARWLASPEYAAWKQAHGGADE